LEGDGMNRIQKQALARVLLDQAGNIVEFWGEQDVPEELKDITVPEIRRQLSNWLKDLPGDCWDMRLTPTYIVHTKTGTKTIVSEEQEEDEDLT
jgi:hypothetical protein